MFKQNKHKPGHFYKKKKNPARTENFGSRKEDMSREKEGLRLS